ncbi:MAG: sensor histidine kinase [Pseudomonadota bacterium]
MTAATAGLLPRLRTGLVLFLTLSFLPPATAADAGTPAPVSVGGDAREIPLDGHLSVLSDPDGNLTLAQVQAASAAGQFTPLAGNLGEGYTREVRWLRFTFTRIPDDYRWWLELLPPFLDNVQLHLVRPDGSVVSKQTGDHFSRVSRDIDARTLLFRLDALPGENTAFLRIETSSSMIAVPTIWRSTEMMAFANGQYLLYGLYLGLIGAVFLFGIITWLLLRDPIYLFYLAYIGAILLYGVASSGLAGQYLLPGNPAMADALVGIGISLNIATGLAFFARMLDLSEGPRWLRLLYVATAMLALVTAACALGNRYIDIIPYLHSAILLTAIASLPLVLQRILRGTPTRQLTGLAVLAYSIMVMISALAFVGLVPSNRFTMFSSQIGNLAHLFLLHAAIMIRTRESEHEREQLAKQAELARMDIEHERQQRDEQDQMLSMITHEIRTPIAVIDAATQSLQLVDEQPPPERRSRYDRIARSVRRLNLLLELALNRVRRNQQDTTRRRSCDLIELTYDVVDQMEPQGGQQLNVWMAMDQAMVCANPDLLRFVFINLLDNACKYSPPGSPVDIEVHAEDRHGRAGFLWAISDRGPGVPAASRIRIFEKYFRAGEEGTTAGLGLGLYIARRVVEQSNGTLNCVESATGARFECWLPVDEHPSGR